MIEIPHLAWPPRLIETPDGGLIYESVEQDSPDHIEDRVQIAARTLIGDRLEDPQFGVPDDVLRAPRVDLDAFRLALADSEPAAALIVERVLDPRLVLTDTLRVLILEEF
jgi:hypothetical protein